MSIADITTRVYDEISRAYESRGVMLKRIQQAVRDYHFALDSREHGDIAAHAALDAIQKALGMEWTQGRRGQATGRGCQMTPDQQAGILLGLMAACAGGLVLLGLMFVWNKISFGTWLP